MTLPALRSIEGAFAQAYGIPPAAVVRAPGRVNLIGEHTDYSDLPVLPIAIEQSLFVAAVATEDATVEAASAQFGRAALMQRQGANAAASWQRYVVGALSQLVDVAPARGAKLFVSGDLPSAGGLSSSSALTMGVIAALLAAWEQPFDPEDVARRATVAERHVGVESGGMDQAVIAHGRAGNALRIDFRPPARTLVPLPQGLMLVVAYSGEEAPKGGTARDAYNERVVGARIAAAMIADQVGVDLDLPLTLGQVSGVDVVDIIVDGLPEKVSAQEVAHGTEVDLQHLVQLTAANFDHMAKVPVKRIARHILSEAQRVSEAQDALISGDLYRFGKLLDESHNSLREDFRCSTPALDRVCAAMRRAGAFGSRLTGAGFGGYALAACERAQGAAVIAAATGATGGPAFEVRAADGMALL